MAETRAPVDSTLPADPVVLLAGASTGIGLALAHKLAAWPSGRIQRLHDLAPNQLLTITEPAPIPLVLAHLQLSPRGRAEGTWVCHFGARCVLEISDDLAVWRKATVLEAQGSTVTDRKSVV